MLGIAKKNLPLLFFLIVLSLLAHSLFVNNAHVILDYELRGLGHDISIENLCDKNFLSGLEKNTSNTSSRKMTSIFYSFLTKLFYPTGISLVILHRVIGLLLFALSILLMYASLRLLKVSRLVSFLATSYYGLSSQILLPLVASQLTLLSIFWLLLLIFIFVLKRSLSLRHAKLSVCLSFLLGLICILGYETYVVARPLALCLAGYFLVYEILSKQRKKSFPALFFGLASAVLLLCYFHPQMAFDLTIFKGDGESLVKAGGAFVTNSFEYLLRRFKEYSLLFKDPFYHYIISWHPVEKTTGWAHVLTFLVALLFLFLAGVKNKRKFIVACKRHRSFLLLLLFVLAVSLVPPVFSTTGVRGHRVFPFYIATTLLAGIFLDVFVAYYRYRIKYFLLSMLLLAVLLLNIKQLQTVTAYGPHMRRSGMQQVNVGAKRVIDQIKTVALPDDVSREVIVICNHDKKLTDRIQYNRYVAWTAILYETRLACDMEAKRLVFLDDQNCTVDNINKTRTLLIRKKNEKLSFYLM